MRKIIYTLAMSMRFFRVLPASQSYKGAQPLVYGSDQNLPPGSLVKIPLRNEICVGIVLETAHKPAFEPKKLTAVSDLPPLPKAITDLAIWMSAYYGCGVGPVARQLVSESYLAAAKTPKLSDDNIPIVKLPQLTAEQEAALTKINGDGTFLLHGETGSGKTRIYIELTKRSLAQGKSAIILTPEIGLTTQLGGQFQAALGEKVIITHSQLTPAERRRVWQKILTTEEPLVVIGPRSALFSPLSNLGLIVIDECHDGSYKQSDSPHYNATTVAAKLAALSHCPLILGSATPSANDYFMAKSRHRPIIRLSKPAIKTGLPPANLETVDLRDRSKFKRGHYLSDELIKTIEAALSRHEQTLLFLNRRGTARVVICADCGWNAACPNCGLPLTYHGDSHDLRCHSCSHREKSPTRCPVCGSYNLNFRGVGTKAIEAEVKKLFPERNIRRFDNDNLKNERLEQIYDQVKSGNVDIIIGTQTIAKGLDLPKLAVVGVIIADTGLFLPDYSADERTYQLIRQVIGRVGRGHVAGSAIIQTYNPDNPLIKIALAGDYTSFYEREIAAREKFHFPPSCHMMKLTLSRASSASAEAAARKLKVVLTNSNLKLGVDGPSPCFHETKNGKYYWQLVLKSPRRSDLLSALATVPTTVASELDPISLL